MKVRISLLVVFLVCAATTQGAYWAFYTNGGGDAMWNNPANWDTGFIPSSVPGQPGTPDYAVGLAAVLPELTIAGYAECPALISGVGGGADDIRVLGTGSLNVLNNGGLGGGNMFLGFVTAAGTPSTLFNDGGSIVVDGQIGIGTEGANVGNGALVMNGGSLNAGWQLGIAHVAGSTGFVQLNDGTMFFNGPLTMGAGGLLEVNGGDLYYHADGPDAGIAELEALIDAGQVTSSVGTVQYEFDNDLYKMHVFIPEPASMMLLGLGGLLLRRRK